MTMPRFPFPSVMFPLMSLLCLAVAAVPAAGQTRFDVAPSAGLFSYRDYAPKSGFIASLELLARHHDLGIGITEEVGGGASHLATYADVTYSHSSGPWSILLGAGPSYVYVQDLESARPFNAEAELGHTWRQKTLFLRFRYCHYVVNGFRERVTMTGPSFSFGARFPVGSQR